MAPAPEFSEGTPLQRQSEPALASVSGNATHAGSTPGLSVEFFPGVAAVPAVDWARLFPKDAEGHAYYTAVEGAPPPGFRFEAITVRRNGQIIAAAPVFHVTYRLDTPLQGRWRPLGDWLFRRAPSQCLPSRESMLHPRR